jgi:hypothetical protein
MTDERFNELLAGALHHPFPGFVLTRLVLALRAVVDDCGQAGEEALERYCRERQQQDEQQEEEGF